MFAQSKLLAMRTLSFRESGLLNQSAGTATSGRQEGNFRSIELLYSLCISGLRKSHETYLIVKCAQSRQDVQLVQPMQVVQFVRMQDGGTWVAELECEVG